MFEAINLDGMTICPRELEDVGVVLANLSTYALMKSRAMRSRLDGNVVVALVLEKKCERIYKKLPAWARW